MNFYQAIKEFKSGQVYEVLVKLEDGNFQSYNKLSSINNSESALESERKRNRFLINIIIQDAILNDH